jgi:hypothetical protein
VGDLMKKNLWFAAIMVFIVFALLYVGSFTAMETSSDSINWTSRVEDTSPDLSLDDLKKAFLQEGLTLENGSNRNYYKLNNVNANMFMIKDGKYAIYIFKSEEELIKGRLDFNNQTALAKVALSHIFEVKNLLVFELMKPKSSGFQVNEILAKLADTPLLLHVMDLTMALSREGIELQRMDEINHYYKLGIDEAGFKINTKDELYIYTFDSADKVDEGLRQIEQQTALLDTMYTPITYKVHNALIMYLKLPANQNMEKKIIKAIYGESS